MIDDSLATPYPELNAVLVELLASVQRIRADRFIGMYSQGSFAVGDFDADRDCDRGERIELAVLHRALNGPQTTLRAYAARELASYGDATSVPFLIDALSDESFHVGARNATPGTETTRCWANESLKALTGEDFGFVWDDPIETRSRAIARWRDWYRQEVGTEPASGADVLAAAVERSAHP